MADLWTYPSEYLNGTGVDGVGDMFFSYPASIVGSNFALGIVLLIWVSFFGIMLTARSTKAVLTASFVSIFFAIFFAIRQELSWGIVFILLILIAIGAVGAKEEGTTL